MDLVLETACGCTMDTLPGRWDMAFPANLMATPPDPLKTNSLRTMWRTAHVIARTIRDNQAGIDCVEKDSELDHMLANEMTDSVSILLRASIENDEA